MKFNITPFKFICVDSVAEYIDSNRVALTVLAPPVRKVARVGDRIQIEINDLMWNGEIESIDLKNDKMILWLY